MKFKAKRYSTLFNLVIGRLDIEIVTMPGAYWSWRPWRRVDAQWDGRSITHATRRVLLGAFVLCLFVAAFGFAGSNDLHDAQVAAEHAKESQAAAREEISSQKVRVVDQKEAGCLLFSRDYKKECAR